MFLSDDGLVGHELICVANSPLDGCVESSPELEQVKYVDPPVAIEVKSRIEIGVAIDAVERIAEIQQIEDVDVSASIGVAVESEELVRCIAACGTVSISINLISGSVGNRVERRQPVVSVSKRSTNDPGAVESQRGNCFSAHDLCRNIGSEEDA